MKVLIGILIVLVLALQYRLWFGDGSVQAYWRLGQDVRNMRNELVRLRSRNQALEAEVADLKSGLDAIEERARTELGMIDEDETFYQFVRPGMRSSPRALDETPAEVEPLLADPLGPDTEVLPELDRDRIDRSRTLDASR